MGTTRTEHDLLGSRELPADAYAGIHTARARENFSLSGYPVPASLLHAFGLVKKACALANRDLGFLKPAVADAMVQACEEVAAGAFDEHLALDALQGGAGTSTNMAVNEVVANRALEILGRAKGDYDTIHPILHVNLHQSTNDVYPTAAKVAAIGRLRTLSEAAASLQNVFQKKEKEFDGILTMGRTEWEDAVPITLGRQFASFADAVARDRWRTFKCEERLRVVNLGGTAVGSGLTAPRSYIFLAAEKLRAVTGLGLTRAENLMDQTANADPFVEVSGSLNAMATNLAKIARDLRFLHSRGELRLPAVQAGSSVMPGKINPVIPECVIQTALKVMANSTIVNECAALGTLQINELMPLLTFALLESMTLLANAAQTLARHAADITADEECCKRAVANSPALITAFLPVIGYEKATDLVRRFIAAGKGDFLAFLTEHLGEDAVHTALTPENLNSLGYRTPPATPRRT